MRYYYLWRTTNVRNPVHCDETCYLDDAKSMDEAVEQAEEDIRSWWRLDDPHNPETVEVTVYEVDGEDDRTVAESSFVIEFPGQEPPCKPGHRHQWGPEKDWQAEGGCGIDSVSHCRHCGCRRTVTSSANYGDGTKYMTLQEQEENENSELEDT